MRPWMFAAPIARVMEQCGRRLRTAERGIVADVNPQPAGIGLALGENRHRRIVAVQSLGGENMRLDPPVQWHKSR